MRGKTRTLLVQPEDRTRQHSFLWSGAWLRRRRDRIASLRQRTAVVAGWWCSQTGSGSVAQSCTSATGRCFGHCRGRGLGSRARLLGGRGAVGWTFRGGEWWWTLGSMRRKTMARNSTCYIKEAAQQDLRVRGVTPQPPLLLLPRCGTARLPPEVLYAPRPQCSGDC
jgi:hypothetical protein